MKITFYVVVMLFLFSCQTVGSLTEAQEAEWTFGIVTEVRQLEKIPAQAAIIPQIRLDNGTILGNGTYMISRSGESKPYLKLVNAAPGDIIEYRQVDERKFEFR